MFYDLAIKNFSDLDENIQKQILNILDSNNGEYGGIYNVVAEIEAECYFDNNEEYLKEQYPEATEDKLISTLITVAHEELARIYPNLGEYNLDFWF